VHCAKESTYGTKATSGWSAVRFLGGFDMIAKPEKIDLSGTDERRSQVEMVKGNTRVEGTISDIQLQPDAFGVILEAALGSVSSGVYTVLNGTLPSLSLEVAYGGHVFEVLGAKVNTLRIEGEAGNLITANVGLVAQKMRELSSPTSRTYSTKKPFVCYKATLTWGGNEVRAQRFAIELNNNLRYPFWELGSEYSAEPSEGRVEITGEFRAIWDSLDEYNDFINCTRGALVINAQNTDGDTMEIRLGNIELTDFGFDRGDQDFDQTLNFKALYDSTDASPIKVTVTTV